MQDALVAALAARGLEGLERVVTGTVGGEGVANAKGANAKIKFEALWRRCAGPCAGAGKSDLKQGQVQVEATASAKSKNGKGSKKRRLTLTLSGEGDEDVEKVEDVFASSKKKMMKKKA